MELYCYFYICKLKMFSSWYILLYNWRKFFSAFTLNGLIMVSTAGHEFAFKNLPTGITLVPVISLATNQTVKFNFGQVRLFVTQHLCGLHNSNSWNALHIYSLNAGCGIHGVLQKGWAQRRFPTISQVSTSCIEWLTF